MRFNYYIWKDLSSIWLVSNLRNSRPAAATNPSSGAGVEVDGWLGSALGSFGTWQARWGDESMRLKLGLPSQPTILKSYHNHHDMTYINVIYIYK